MGTDKKGLPFESTGRKLRASRENPEIRDFLLRNIPKHPTDITTLVSVKFGISRPAVHGYLQRAIKAELIAGHGTTRARKYDLKPLVDFVDKIALSHGLSEDAVWRFKILPVLQGLPPNIRDICQYGFTEILNNAIDHSGSRDALISIKSTYASVTMSIIDHGIGIFQKIQNDFKLPDARSALLELSKGSITSDRRNHAGEGIFFTSRMFDVFALRSGPLFYMRRKQEDDDWLIEAKDAPFQRGTSVEMEISTDAHWTAADIFTHYRNDRERFRKTYVAIGLSAYPGEQLVSRSQAKRVLARFDMFHEVVLDFRGVDFIGQGFADEIFRIFCRDHPDVHLVEINVHPDVAQMIEHVRRAQDTGEMTSPEQ